MNKENVCIFWFRRDLRLQDNTALYHALKENINVLTLFIFDNTITNTLHDNDQRIQFIYLELQKINLELSKYNSSILIKSGYPLKIFNELSEKYHITAIYYNNDYEPYAIERDHNINDFAKHHNIIIKSYKDHVIFEKNDILKEDKTPYIMFTPYAKKWLESLTVKKIKKIKINDYTSNFYHSKIQEFPSIEALGFKTSNFIPPIIRFENIYNYENERDYPSLDSTTKAGIHLRFGTLSIRHAVNMGLKYNNVWLKELIWREFFMMILWHFPYVTSSAFKKQYNNLEWENDSILFDKWCKGKTGYPIVDAGMRELNSTGYMHNRVRMITASFLVKHLLINWQWGENYFAEKLLDYELSSNNGNWQWAAGTGCDAAPYFRIFNPELQQKKFDRNKLYINKWIPELNSPSYPKPIVVHELARKRCLLTYKKIIF